MDKILVLDFGSQYSHLICRRIREFSVFAELVPYDISYEEIQKHFPIKFKGYIPSGFIDIKLNEYQVDQKYHDFKSNDDNYISFMIQLNNDYNEGYFQFLINDGESYFQVNHGAGHLVLFFSNLKQRTTPVKSGIKKTL